MLHVFIGVLIVLFFLSVLLPVEIRVAKGFYRSVVLVWAQEVRKAWME